ncbi:Uncharacterized protein MLTONO_p0547 (plasmid) [Mesorhizobium loti]|nr:Uncharacterized protein MLTONO_p0547 [Mesorhizobium loti]
MAFVRRIRARCRKTGDAANGGRPRDDLLPGLRTVPFDTVQIVNVFYGGRDYEAPFRDQEGES